MPSQYVFEWTYNTPYWLAAQAKFEQESSYLVSQVPWEEFSDYVLYIFYDTLQAASLVENIMDTSVDLTAYTLNNVVGYRSGANDCLTSPDDGTALGYYSDGTSSTDNITGPTHEYRRWQVCSVYVKHSSCPSFRVQLDSTHHATFDWQATSPVFSSQVGIDNYSVDGVGNGWYRIWIYVDGREQSLEGVADLTVQIFPNYGNTDQRGLYLWNAQLEFNVQYPSRALVTPQNRVLNLLDEMTTSSYNFDTTNPVVTGWTLVGSDLAYFPGGVLDLSPVDTDVSAFTLLPISATDYIKPRNSFFLSERLVVSYYVNAGLLGGINGDEFKYELYNVTQSVSHEHAFTWQPGPAPVATSTALSDDSGIESVGGGWYRVWSMVEAGGATSSAAVGDELELRIYPVINTTGLLVAGALWGVQVQNSTDELRLYQQTPYTDRQNLVPYTADFAQWAISSIDIELQSDVTLLEYPTPIAASSFPVRIKYLADDDDPLPYVSLASNIVPESEDIVFSCLIAPGARPGGLYDSPHPNDFLLAAVPAAYPAELKRVAGRLHPEGGLIDLELATNPPSGTAPYAWGYYPVGLGWFRVWFYIDLKAEDRMDDAWEFRVYPRLNTGAGTGLLVHTPQIELGVRTPTALLSTEASVSTPTPYNLPPIVNNIHKSSEMGLWALSSCNRQGYGFKDPLGISPGHAFEGDGTANVHIVKGNTDRFRDDNVFSIFCKRGTASQFKISMNNIEALTIHEATVDWLGGLPEISESLGLTGVGYEASVDGWFRIYLHVNIPFGDAEKHDLFELALTPTTVAASTENTHFALPQLEFGVTSPSEYEETSRNSVEILNSIALSNLDPSWATANSTPSGYLGDSLGLASEQFIGDGASGAKSLSQVHPTGFKEHNVFSALFRQGTADRFGLSMAPTATYPGTDYNLTMTWADGIPALVSESVDNYGWYYVGDGWWKVWIYINASTLSETGESLSNYVFYADTDANAETTEVTQLVQEHYTSSPTSLYKEGPAPPSNRVPDSEDLTSTAGWVFSNVISALSVNGPDNQSSHLISRDPDSFDEAAHFSTPLTGSEFESGYQCFAIYAKKQSSTEFALEVYDASAASSKRLVRFGFDAQGLLYQANQSGVESVGFVPVSDGWYRVWISTSSDEWTNAGNNLVVRVYPAYNTQSPYAGTYFTMPDFVKGFRAPTVHTRTIFEMVRTPEVRTNQLSISLDLAALTLSQVDPQDLYVNSPVSGVPARLFYNDGATESANIEVGKVILQEDNCFSCYVQKGTSSRVRLELEVESVSYYADFVWDTFSALVPDEEVVSSTLTASVLNEDDNWYRAYIYFSAGTTILVGHQATFRIYPDYVDGSSMGPYLFGPQVEHSTDPTDLQLYPLTASLNIVEDSNNIESALTTWSESGVGDLETVSPYAEFINGAVAGLQRTPLGSSPISGVEAVYRTVGVWSEYNTYSIFVREDSAPQMGLRMTPTGGATEVYQVTYLWTAGVPVVVNEIANGGAVQAALSSGVISVGGGWFRIWMAVDGVLSGLMGASRRCIMYPHYLGTDELVGTYFYGVQVENTSALPLPYNEGINDSVEDHRPTPTNLLPNSQEFSQWSISTPDSVVIGSDFVAAPDGLDPVLKVEGLTAYPNDHFFQTCVIGEQLVVSAYVKYADAPKLKLAVKSSDVTEHSVTLTWDESTTEIASLVDVNNDASRYTTIGDGWYRLHMYLDSGTRSIDGELVEVRINGNTAAVVDNEGSFVWGVQAESGCVAPRQLIKTPLNKAWENFASDTFVPTYPWLAFHDTTDRIINGGYSSAEIEDIAAQGLGFWSIEYLWTSVGSAVLRSIKAINPGFQAIGVWEKFTGVPIATPSPVTNEWGWLLKVLLPETALHVDGSDVINYPDPSDGAATHLSRSPLPITGNSSTHNANAVSDLMNQFEIRATQPDSYRGLIDGVVVESPTSAVAGPPAFATEVSTHGAVDLNQNSTAHASDTADQDSWIAFQLDILDQLRAIMGSDFLILPAGTTGYPDLYGNGEEPLLQHLYNGAVYEGFPALSEAGWNPRAAMEAIEQGTQSGFHRIRRSQIREILTLKGSDDANYDFDNGTSQYAEAARLASLVFLTPYVRRANSSQIHTVDSEIPTLVGAGAGLPVGNLSIVDDTPTVGYRTWSRTFTNGTAQITCNSDASGGAIIWAESGWTPI